ncbi:unnamed protein product [Phaedon cochleariae]|uniref:BED-type domain-containing protein n=1 Tax=Phaedon cochleariae TaxID=80249 RepID=A0A9N9SE74_PHACE|nr:unnamed protein product [Phaedon cochleariae]
MKPKHPKLSRTCNAEKTTPQIQIIPDDNNSNEELADPFVCGSDSMDEDKSFEPGPGDSVSDSDSDDSVSSPNTSSAITQSVSNKTQYKKRKLNNVIVKNKRDRALGVSGKLLTTFFTMVSTSTNNNDKVGTCQICKKQIQMKNANNTGLKRHLFARHQKQYHEIFPEVEAAALAGAKKSGSRQGNIKEMFNFDLQNQSKKPPAITQKKFEEKLVEWIAVKYLPFSFFDDDQTQEIFHDFRQLEDSSALLPKRSAMRSKVVASYFYVKNHPTNGDWCLHSPPNFKAISVSTPLHAQGHPRSGSMRTAAGPFRPLRRPTSSHAQDHPRPRSLTSLRRRCGAVTCSRPPTFEVAASLRRVFSDPFEGPHRLTLKTTHVQVTYDLQQKIQGITVDNVSANTLFMSELSKIIHEKHGKLFDEEDQHFRCIAHVLNLAVQDLLKILKIENDGADAEIEADTEDEEMEIENENCDDEEDTNVDTSPVLKIRALCKKIKASEQWQLKLKTCCELTNVKMLLTLIIDVPTRWNSTFDMIKVSLKMRHPLNALCDNNAKLKFLRVNENEWDLLKQICGHLHSFKSLSTLLGGEKYVTLPMVVMSLNILIDKLEEDAQHLDQKIDRTEVDEAIILALQAARDKILKHYAETNWDIIQDKAEGILVVPPTQPWYPLLLKLTSDGAGNIQTET